MGIYLNPGKLLFKEAVNSQIYVDKSGLIEYTNNAIGTEQKLLCVSRPRRFGKSMAANMLVAYYEKSEDSHDIFDNLYISGQSSYEQHINKYDVLFLNIQRFFSRVNNKSDMIAYMQKKIINDLRSEFNEYISAEADNLVDVFEELYAKTKKQFIFIIDEWDCIFRELKDDMELQKSYLDFLRDLFKGQPYTALVYMTGILPIKKYGTHSALNMFDEYSMTDMSTLGSFTGFTADETTALCNEYCIDIDEMNRWYNGYIVNGIHIYSPKSVVDSIRHKNFASYWTSTETYEALRSYIDIDFDGMKNVITRLIADEHIGIDITSFGNDMTTFKSKDDVLTLLIHLGYLGYDPISKKTFIPNEEIRGEFITSINVSRWDEVTVAISNSEALLSATPRKDPDTVARAIDKVHSDTTSILTYNNENSLSCVISLAYYSARNYYTLVREMPSGKGFADIVFIPHKNINRPAIVVELKWNSSADAAIEQIRSKNYTDALKGYSGDIILVGINYDKTTKKHSCVIESFAHKTN